MGIKVMEELKVIAQYNDTDYNGNTYLFLIS